MYAGNDSIFEESMKDFQAIEQDENKNVEEVKKEKLTEITTWGDLGWRMKSGASSPKLSGYSVKHLATGKVLKIVGTDEKYVQLEGDKEIPVGDAFVYGKEYELLDPDGNAVEVDRRVEEDKASEQLNAKGEKPKEPKNAGDDVSKVAKKSKVNEEDKVEEQEVSEEQDPAEKAYDDQVDHVMGIVKDLAEPWVDEGHLKMIRDVIHSLCTAGQGDEIAKAQRLYAIYRKSLDSNESREANEKAARHGTWSKTALEKLRDAWDLIGSQDDDAHIRTLADEKVDEINNQLEELEDSNEKERKE